MNGLRLPKANYKGTNGFLDTTLKEDQPQAMAAPPANSSNEQTDAERAKKIRDDISVHRATEDMLEIKGSYFPG